MPSAYDGREPPGASDTASMHQPGITTPPGRGSSSSTIRSTVTSDRAAASTASFCTPGMPHSCTFPARSASCACTIATSGRSAGTATSSSPVNGHVTRSTRVCLSRSVPTYPRMSAHGIPEAPAA